MAEKIRRNLMLREYDIKQTPAGKQTVFSIKFIKVIGWILLNTSWVFKNPGTKKEV